MKKHIFLTGATGLLGRNLAEMLLDKGYRVTALVRDTAAFKEFRHQEFQLVMGNLFSDCTRWLQDVDAVVHAAAETGQHHLRYATYWQTNTNATIQLFQAARFCKVGTFIFVSTANTLAHGTPGKPGDERNSYIFPFSSSLYARSKMEAEKYILESSSEIRTMIIHPGFILGKYAKAGGSGRMVKMGLGKRILFVPPGGKSFVHVKDVCSLIINVLESGSSGEKYLAVNENLSYTDFFIKLGAITGKRPAQLVIPSALLVFAGHVGDLLRRMGVTTAISSVNMRILCVTNYYSNKKSVEAFGMSYLPIDTAIRDTLLSLQK